MFWRGFAFPSWVFLALLSFPLFYQCVPCVWAAHTLCQACPGECALPSAGLLASYEDLPEAAQAALLASALPSMPPAWRAEVTPPS